MKTIETAIDIAAPRARVWKILTDIEAVPDWNPFITAVQGRLTAGSRLQVTVVPQGQKPMNFRPTVLAVSPERELRWRGTVLGRYGFAGEHFFHLQDNGSGGTLFRHGESFSGLLVPILLTSTMLTATRGGFLAMNDALKARAEGSY